MSNINGEGLEGSHQILALWVKGLCDEHILKAWSGLSGDSTWFPCRGTVVNDVFIWSLMKCSVCRISAATGWEKLRHGVHKTGMLPTIENVTSELSKVCDEQVHFIPRTYSVSQKRPQRLVCNFEKHWILCQQFLILSFWCIEKTVVSFTKNEPIVGSHREARAELRCDWFWFDIHHIFSWFWCLTDCFTYCPVDSVGTSLHRAI